MLADLLDCVCIALFDCKLEYILSELGSSLGDCFPKLELLVLLEFVKSIVGGISVCDTGARVRYVLTYLPQVRAGRSAARSTESTADSSLFL